MVTVLNKPTNFVYGKTLDEMQTVLADNNAEGIYYPKRPITSLPITLP